MMTRLAILLASLAAVVLAFVFLGGCTTGTAVVVTAGLVPVGTWGGDNAGLIVGDTSAHLHVGCTFGDISGRIALDRAGQFDVPGRYLLRAYPIAIGPTVPARFTGDVVGRTLTITATITDTVQQTTVVKGPVTVTLDEAPRMGVCPICRRPYSGRRI